MYNVLQCTVIVVHMYSCCGWVCLFVCVCPYKFHVLALSVLACELLFVISQFYDVSVLFRTYFAPHFDNFYTNTKYF